jgi:hypothetical protein
MHKGELRLIRHCAEFRPKTAIVNVPHKTRGIYVLLQHKPSKANIYNVVYIGMSRSGVRGRLTAHDKSKKKRGKWSHFSVYSVWPNISDAEIEELEGLFRAIYRRDATANSIAIHKRYAKLWYVMNDQFHWS